MGVEKIYILFFELIIIMFLLANVSADPPFPPFPPSLPENISCIDSDGGNFPYVSGLLNLGTNSYQDFCNGKSLTEYYCQNNQVNQENYICDYGCSESGFCIQNEEDIPIETVYCGEPQKITYEEEQKNKETQGNPKITGEQIEEKTFARKIFQRIRNFFVESYLGISGRSVNGQDPDATGCPNDYTCQEGTCIYNPPILRCNLVNSFDDCEPYGMCDANADGEFDLNDYDKIRYYLLGLNESCGANENECYCDLNQDGSVSNSDAILLRRYLNPINQSCNDSDGGINKEIYGILTINYSNGQFYQMQDTCYSNENVLKEFYCNETLFSYIDINCGNTTCENGVCTANLYNPNLIISIEWISSQNQNGYSAKATATSPNGLSFISGTFYGPITNQSGNISCRNASSCYKGFGLIEGPGEYVLTVSATNSLGEIISLTESRNISNVNK